MVYIAIRATDAARDAVVTTREGMERQANEDRLSTAIEAIGGERVGGLALLRRHVGSQLPAAIDEEGSAEDAALLYTTALDVLENYLRNPPDDPTDGGLGYGRPTCRSTTSTQLMSLRDGGPEVGGGGARHSSKHRRRSGERPATRPALEGHRPLVARRALLQGHLASGGSHRPAPPARPRRRPTRLFGRTSSSPGFSPCRPRSSGA
jgi:hypothetical protein